MSHGSQATLRRSPGTLSLADYLIAITLFGVGAAATRFIMEAAFQSIAATTWIVLAFLYWRSRMIATLLIHLTGIAVAALFFLAMALLKADEMADVICSAIEPAMVVGVPLAVSISLAYGTLSLSTRRRDIL